MSLLSNFKLLRDDMIKNDWVITAFTFPYKKQNYVVLVKVIDREIDKNIPEYAILKLEFINIEVQGEQRSLTVYANSSTLFLDIKTLRKFFGIDWGTNLGNLRQQFYQSLAVHIPTKANPNLDEVQKEEAFRSLSISESEDPEKRFCYAVRRNPKNSGGTNQQRSPYNSNKMRLANKELYDYFAADTGISFLFTKNQTRANKTNREIINQFAQGENR